MFMHSQDKRQLLMLIDTVKESITNFHLIRDFEDSARKVELNFLRLADAIKKITESL